MLAGCGLEIEIEAILNIVIHHSIPFHAIFASLASLVLLCMPVYLMFLWFVMPSK